MCKSELIELLNNLEEDNEIVLQGRVEDEFYNVGNVRVLEDGSILIETK